MNESSFISLIAEAGPILKGFLGTLLNQEANLEIGDPKESSMDALTSTSEHSFIAVTQTDGPHAYAIQFESGWLSPVSTAMLGMDMDPADEGSGDLISEIISQGYGSLRNTLSEGGHLPEMYFDILQPGKEPKGSLIEGTVWELPFEATLGETRLAGALFLSDATVALINELVEPEPEMAAEPQPVAEPVDIASPRFPDLGREQLIKDGNSNFALLAEVELSLTVELGRRRLPLSEVLQLTPGSVIELEKLVGEPLEIYANGRLIAEGEAVVVDEQFGVRITNLSNAKLRSKIAA